MTVHLKQADALSLSVVLVSLSTGLIGCSAGQIGAPDDGNQANLACSGPGCVTFGDPSPPPPFAPPPGSSPPSCAGQPNCVTGYPMSAPVSPPTGKPGQGPHWLACRSSCTES